MTRQIIEQVPLFNSLPETELDRLAQTLERRKFQPGEMVFNEGETGDRFYMVVTGSIEVLKSVGTPEERLIAVRGPGSYVGEMSLFDQDRLRTASVRAHTAVELLVMTRDDFDTLIHRYPALTFNLVRELSERLSVAHNTTIRDLREKNQQLTKAYEELKSAQAQLIEKERLEKELAVARQIQESILPRDLPQLPWLDLGARLAPTRAVGGDLFDVLDLGDQKLGIAVADVSDKGVPAAIFMALTRSLLRAEASRTSSPAQVLSNVNRLLLDMNDAGMFVTVLYGIVDGTKYTFHYVRAGHELPLVISADGQIVPVPMGKGQPLALFETPALDEQVLPFPPDSFLVVYTDGVTDQNNHTREFFGVERLQAAACLHRALPAQDACDRLFESVNAFRGSEAQTDDITFVVAKALGP